jgi:hypothetical protein
LKRVLRTGLRSHSLGGKRVEKHDADGFQGHRVAANVDFAAAGERRDDFAGASLNTSSIAFVLYWHVLFNNRLRVTARSVSASPVDLAAAPLSVQVATRRPP